MNNRHPSRSYFFWVFLGATMVPALKPCAEPPTADPQWLGKDQLGLTIVVADLAKARKFYGAVLGMKESSATSQSARFSAGEASINVITLDPMPPAFPGGIQKGIGIRLLTLIYNDLDPIVERALAAGLPKPGLLGSREAGGRLIFILDPDGNQVELLESNKETSSFSSSMIGLTVADIEKSREFYGKTLGLPELPARTLFPSGGPMKYSFRAGRTIIKFWKFDKPLEARTGAVEAALGFRTIDISVKDLKQTLDQLKAQGAAIPDLKNSAAMGSPTIIQDPDGNWLRLLPVADQ